MLLLQWLPARPVVCFLTFAALLQTDPDALLASRLKSDVAVAPQIGTFLKDFDAFKAMVRKVEAPGLIINQESSAPAGQSSAELMAADMQDGQGCAVPVSYHQVMQDQPDAVNKLILDFLKTKVCHTRV